MDDRNFHSKLIVTDHKFVWEGCICNISIGGVIIELKTLTEKRKVNTDGEI